MSTPPTSSTRADTHYYPTGMPTSLDYPAVVIPDLLRSAAAMYGNRTAVVDGDRSLSYTQLLDGAHSVAADLVEHGVKPGDIVGIQLPNVLHYLTVYYGALAAGAGVTLVNPLQPAHALFNQLKDAQVSAVVTHPAHLDALAEIHHELGLRRVLIAEPTQAAGASEEQLAAASAFVAREQAVFLETVLARPADDFQMRRVSTDDVAHLAFTGGTTGTPKAVRVLHRNVVANIVQMTAWRLNCEVTTTDDGLVQLQRIESLAEPYVVAGESSTIQVPPLFHAQGLTSSGTFVLGGVTIVLLGRFNPDKFVELAREWNAQYVSSNPPMYLALAAHCEQTGQRIPSITLAMSGAAPLDKTTVERVQSIMPHASFGEAYGLTEATCLVLSSAVQPGAVQRLGSVGVPVPDTEIQIRAANGTTVLGDGEEGELWVRGPQVTDGYNNAPKQTAAQFINGWLATGDIASRDEEGFYRIHDRTKDMLIYKGYNVYPRELEDIGAAHPGVAQIAVIGRPDPDVGQLPVAFVIAKPNSSLTESELMDYVAQRVLPYQKIREVHFVDTLPASPTGKILKTEIRQYLD